MEPENPARSIAGIDTKAALRWKSHGAAPGLLWKHDAGVKRFFVTMALLEKIRFCVGLSRACLAYDKFVKGRFFNDFAGSA
ncbi:MAG: hypothetical protein KGQ52_11235 [Alphaproteobacteria bacterium]|nr:hypothetical protein [Alphaproteobacteria bacterium]